MDLFGWNTLKPSDFGKWSMTTRFDYTISSKPVYGIPYVSISFDPFLLTNEDILFADMITNAITHIPFYKEKSLEVKNQTVKLETFLGKGGFGHAYKCTFDSSQAVCKYSDKSILYLSDGSQCPSTKNSFLTEAYIHTLLTLDEKGKELCSTFLYVAYNSEIGPVIFTELLDGTVVHIQKSRDVEKPRNKKVFCSLILQMCDALEYMQSKYKFIHGDLKLDNIGFRKVPNHEIGTTGFSNNGFQFVLIDFGLSTMTALDGSVICTHSFITPRVYADMKFPNSADLSLLLNSCFCDFLDRGLINAFIIDLLWFPNMTNSMINVISFDKHTIPVYIICYSCHNPNTTTTELRKAVCEYFMDMRKKSKVPSSPILQ